MIRTASFRTRAAVPAVILLMSVLLSWLAAQVDHRAEQALLHRQVEQAASVLGNAVAVLQVQLADAGQVATATGAAIDPFDRFAAAQITRTGSFASVSLLRVQDGTTTVLTTDGSAPLLPAGGLQGAFFRGLRPDGRLTVAGILPARQPRLGYALMPAGTSGLVVYAEQVLHPDQAAAAPADAAFGGLEFAVYLGPRPAADQLLLATAGVPIVGDTQRAALPFGNSSITVVGAARERLTGKLAAALPAIVLGVGAVLALVSGLALHVLLRRKAVAELLAAENGRLYLHQRSIAGTLQHALLPKVPRLDGIEVAARYVAGVDELEVGGDWFDVLPAGPGRCVFVVGDISGSGLAAATTMAALRFSVRAYVTQGDDVATVLRKLRSALDVSDGHQFATVLLGELDTLAGTLTLVCAGHFAPLLVAGGRAVFLDCPVGLPVGVDGLTTPPPTVVRLHGPATLLAFTDGLVERRGEVVDAGLERLCRAAVDADGRPVEAMLDAVMASMGHDGGADDTVLMGLRWGG